MEFLNKQYITGRGLCLAYKLDKEDKYPQVKDKWFWVNKYYLITGVEGSTLLVYPPVRSPYVGITVREITEEEYHG